MLSITLLLARAFDFNNTDAVDAGLVESGLHFIKPARPDNSFDSNHLISPVHCGLAQYDDGQVHRSDQLQDWLVQLRILELVERPPCGRSIKQYPFLSRWSPVRKELIDGSDRRDTGRFAAVASLAMVGEVEAHLFSLVRRAEAATDSLDNERDDYRADHRQSHGRADIHQLREDRRLEVAAVEQTRVAGRVDRRGGEQTDRDRAEGTTDTVDAEDVEGIVSLQGILDLDREEADARDEDADEERADRVHETTGRGDGDETRHRARAEAKGRRLLIHEPIEEHPG